MQHIEIGLDFGANSFWQPVQILDHAVYCAVFGQQLKRRLLADPLNAGIIVARIAHEAFEIDNLGRCQAFFL
ncbi:hypothetical protein D3C71_2118000 [compost metagenome]